VECKAPEVNLKATSLQQIGQYNRILKARFIAVTNGIKHYIWAYHGKDYEALTSFPPFPGSQ
jgi:hypothetical protein